MGDPLYSVALPLFAQINVSYHFLCIIVGLIAVEIEDKILPDIRVLVPLYLNYYL
jgi:hypothetical protein